MHEDNKRIAFIGNDCNCTYWYVKLLRQENINAYLYIAFKEFDADGNPIIPSGQDDPRGEDASLKGKLPEWVLLFNPHSLSGVVNTWRELNGYDLNIACGRWSAFVQFCRPPFISFAIGSDLRELVYKINPLSILYKLAVKRSKAILFDNVDTGTLNSLKNLKVKHHYWIPDYISNEYLLNGASNDSRTDSILNNFSEKLILFSPARLNFPQKGTNVLIKGFSRFIQNSGGKDSVRLLMIDYGEDRERTRELIRETGAGDNITLLPLMSPREVQKLIRLADIVLGYFKFNEYGVHHYPVVLEDAMALGRPIISSIDFDAFRVVAGEEPPIILAAFSEHDVAEKIQAAVASYSEIADKSAHAGPAWINKYHSAPFIIEKLKRIINEHSK